MQEAALAGHLDVVSLLIDAGASWDHDRSTRWCLPQWPATATPSGDCSRKTRACASARHPDQLVRAAGRDSYEAAALLIELGFDVNVRPRMAPLHEAAMRGNLAAIRRLLTTAPTTPTSTTRSMTRRRRDGRTITATARSAVSCSKDSSDPTRPPR